MYRWCGASGARAAALPDLGRPAGRLYVIVGPSGAGKDTLIDWLGRHLPPGHGVLFVRRAITRPPALDSEIHEPMTEAEFAAAAAEGRFCLTWQAHGLSYGIPATARAYVEAGGVAVLNGSRHALPAILAVFPQARVIVVTVDPEERWRRLAARGREDKAAIAARVERSDGALGGIAVAAVVDNSGPVDEAGAALMALVTGSQFEMAAP